MSPLDLNLLAVFDALYELRSVTRTAQRLHVTQSAVSHALRRLRETMGDPLFVRSAGTLQPTARAHDMAADVQEGLARLRAVMAPPAFDPALAVRMFTLAAGSYFCALLIPRLLTDVRRVAPGITFRIVPVSADLPAELDQGRVELALGAFDRVPPRLTVHPLFREELVWIAASANPICARHPTADDLLRQPHLVIATRRAFEPIGALLAEGPLERHLMEQPGADRAIGPVSAVVYDALTAAAMVSQTDTVALIPRRLALSEKDRLGLTILQPGGDRPGIDLGVMTHHRASSDAGIAWIRSRLVELSR